MKGPPAQALVHLPHNYGEMVIGRRKPAKGRGRLGSSAKIDIGNCVMCLDRMDKIWSPLSGSLECLACERVALR